MSGAAYLTADQEPYESGVFEDAQEEEIEEWVHVHYCETCNKVMEIWSDSQVEQE